MELFDLLLYKSVAGGDSGGGVDPESITLVTLNVSQNGTTNAPSGTAYNKVVANVPNTYGASDEGKVVSNGSLVSQTAHAEVTQNGVVDTTLNNSVTVNVPSGGEEIFYTSRGIGYAKNTVNPATTLDISMMYNNANDLETLEFTNFAGTPVNYFIVDCANLKSVRFLGAAKPSSSNCIRFSAGSSPCKIEEVQFGSIGHPADSGSEWSQYSFGIYSGNIRKVVVYVEAQTIADVPSNIKTYQPWGTGVRAVEYRSSTTGEVLA